MTSIFPNHSSNVAGRKAWFRFDASGKTIIGYNGALLANAPGFTVTTWPENVFHITTTAKLNLATNGDLDFGELADHSGLAITADGDGGTFIVLYA